jgi:hypothetical protein
MILIDLNMDLIMKLGDLIRVAGCPEQAWEDYACECFFCSGNSNRVGLVMAHEPLNSWRVMFDCGERRVDDFEEARGEVKVISKQIGNKL